ncbi:MAG: SRPBCC family protein [Ignavibacteriae bacterium]|nr:SRPBCC family protein [Ignavibacteriota bacterium]
MEQDNKIKITVKATVNSPVEKVWEMWTNPEHIVKWNNASDDWHTTKAENDLRTGGKFLSRMEAKDGSFGFDFEGIYDKVVPNKLIEYSLGDIRKVKVEFEDENGKTNITEIFDAETTNSVELQRTGWQAILDNFKKYTESN